MSAAQETELKSGMETETITQHKRAKKRPGCLALLRAFFRLFRCTCKNQRRAGKKEAAATVTRGGQQGAHHQQPEEARRAEEAAAEDTEQGEGCAMEDKSLILTPAEEAAGDNENEKEVDRSEEESLMEEVVVEDNAENNDCENHSLAEKEAAAPCRAFEQLVQCYVPAEYCSLLQGEAACVLHAMQHQYGVNIQLDGSSGSVTLRGGQGRDVDGCYAALSAMIAAWQWWDALRAPATTPAAAGHAQPAAAETVRKEEASPIKAAEGKKTTETEQNMHKTHPIDIKTSERVGNESSGTVAARPQALGAVVYCHVPAEYCQMLLGEAACVLHTLQQQHQVLVQIDDGSSTATIRGKDRCVNSCFEDINAMVATWQWWDALRDTAAGDEKLENGMEEESLVKEAVEGNHVEKEGDIRLEEESLVEEVVEGPHGRLTWAEEVELTQEVWYDAEPAAAGDSASLKDSCKSLDKHMRDPSGHEEAQVTRTVHVPAQHRKKVMGHKGQFIARLRNDFNVQISYDARSGHLGIRGPASRVHRCHREATRALGLDSEGHPGGQQQHPH